MSRIQKIAEFDTIQVRNIIPIDENNNRISSGLLFTVGNKGITTYKDSSQLLEAVDDKNFESDNKNKKKN